MYPTQLEILNQEIDPEGQTPSHYRILVSEKHFKYVTIDPGIYEVDDLCFPPALVEKLPSFPEGDWNCGRISQTTGNPTSVFSETLKKTLASINPLWHPKSHDYLSFQFGKRLRACSLTSELVFIMGFEPGYDKGFMPDFINLALPYLAEG